MIRSFSSLVEIKNKLILKMNKYNLAVTYFLGVSLSGEPSEPLSIEIGWNTINTKRITGNSDIREHFDKCSIRVIIGIHFIHPQN